MRILIVEDDPALLQAIEACFEVPKSVYNLVSASRLEDALGVLRSQTVDVVLFDLRLPGNDGLEGAERILDVWNGPVVIITVRDDEDLAISALQSGVQDYLVKGTPGWTDSLQRAVRRAVERHRKQAAVEAEKSALEALVADERKRLSHAREELLRSSRQQDVFLASVSHELLTPLSTILGLAESLALGTYGPLNEPQKRVASDIEATGQHLLALVNDILDLAKLQAGKLQTDLEPVRVDEVCAACLSRVQALADQTTVRLGLSPEGSGARVMTDPGCLEKMLANLLDNAIKFTPSGGEAGMDVALRDGCVEISVWDTGIGLEPEMIPRAFEPFLQLDSGRLSCTPGTGLGLPLVDHLARLMGIELDFNSEVGKGTRVTLRIPLLSSKEAPPASRMTARGA